MKHLARISLGVAMASLVAGLAQTQQPEFDLRKPAWRRATILFKWEICGIDEIDKKAKPFVDQALIREKDEPILPGYFPVVRKEMVMYRDYTGITAVFAHDRFEAGKRVARAGDTAWRSVEFERSLCALVGYIPAALLFGAIFDAYRGERLARLLVENPTAGLMSSDDSLIYAVNDMALPKPGSLKDRWTLAALSGNNVLHSFDPSSGLHIWWSGQRDLSDPTRRRPFDEAHFLGPPLPAKKKLWALNEDDSGQVRLVIIDPAKKNKHFEPMVLDPLLRLYKVPPDELYRNSLLRRISPVRLTFADGVLICPTHAGMIFGVDPEKNQVAWSFTYRKPVKAPPKARILDPDPRNGLDLAWRYPAPYIADGKLVFTAADDLRVHCLQVKDGKPLWAAKNDGDLYLAGVFGDKVVLVGGKECRALGLADGKEAWRIKSGVPSGMGAADGGKYYLPLRKGEGGQAEVCVIDIASGKVAHRLPTPENEPLGNLVFHEDLLISQSATVIMAFARKR